MLDIKRTKLPNGGILSEWPDGTTIWSLNNKWHREDGPAAEYPNGGKYWCLNGKLHCEDGHAMEYDGHKYWYINGIHIPCTTQKQFERLMKLKAFW
jgi:hypothetical protein